MVQCIGRLTVPYFCVSAHRNSAIIRLFPSLHFDLLIKNPHHAMLLRLFSLAERLSLPSKKTIRLLSGSARVCNETGTRKPAEKFNYNSLAFDEKPEAEHTNYPTVTANELQKETQPPKGVKMLVRDYIEDSLYNPHYGYFSKQAKILSSINTDFDYSRIDNTAMFQSELAKRYAEHGSDDDEGPGRQIWHTPTELFKVSPDKCKLAYPAQTRK